MRSRTRPPPPPDIIPGCKSSPQHRGCGEHYADFPHRRAQRDRGIGAEHDSVSASELRREAARRDNHGTIMMSAHSAAEGGPAHALAMQMRYAAIECRRTFEK